MAQIQETTRLRFHPMWQPTTRFMHCRAPVNMPSGWAKVETLQSFLELLWRTTLRKLNGNLWNVDSRFKEAREEIKVLHTPLSHLILRVAIFWLSNPLVRNQFLVFKLHCLSKSSRLPCRPFSVPFQHCRCHRLSLHLRWCRLIVLPMFSSLQQNPGRMLCRYFFRAARILWLQYRTPGRYHNTPL